MDRGREHLVPHDREREQEAEPPVPARVEDEARGDDERPPALGPRLEEPRERQHDHEEDREGGGREEHASRTAAGAVRVLLLRLRWRQAGRGAVVRRDVERGVVADDVEPRRVVRQPRLHARRPVHERPLAHRAARGRPLGDRDEEPGDDHHARDHRRVEAGDGGERRDADEEEDLQQEPRDREAARPRRVDGADPARALADDRAALVPSGLLAVRRTGGRVSRAGARAARPGGRRPGRRGSGRRREPRPAPRATGSRETCVVSDGSATALPAQASSEGVISSTVARPCACTSARRSSTDASAGAAGLRLDQVVLGARLRELRAELVGRIGRRRLRGPASSAALGPAPLPPLRNARMPSATSAILMSLRTRRWYRHRGSRAIRAGGAALTTSGSFLPRPGSVRSRRRRQR